MLRRFLPPGAGRFCLAVGTAEPRKDLPGLVRAFGAVAGRQADVALVLAGPPGWGEQALDVGRRGVAGAATGSCARAGCEQADLAALLSRASVLAYPSLYEGFGFPPLQAMRAGVPVVATRAGSLPEVLGDGALLVDAGRSRRPGRGARARAWATRRGAAASLPPARRGRPAYTWEQLRRRARGALSRRGGRPWLSGPRRRCSSPSSSCGGACPAASAPTPAACSAAWPSLGRGGRRGRGDAPGQPGARRGGRPAGGFGRPVHTSRLPGPLLTRAWDHGLSHAPGGFDVVHSVSLASPRLRRSSPGAAGRHGARRGLAPPPRGDDAARACAGTRRRCGGPTRRGRPWSSRPGWWRPTWRRWASTPSRVTVVPSGADHLPAARPRRRPTRSSGGSGVAGEFLLTVSTLEPRKNVDRLVQAFAPGARLAARARGRW